MGDVFQLIDPLTSEAIHPQSFSTETQGPAAKVYLSDASAGKLAEFFQTKGLAALKAEDQRQQWYDDWLAYQTKHRIYASVLSPKQFSSLGYQFDLLKLARLLEVFAYFSPAHGYSLQVTFLGLFPILMGGREDLKKQAVAALEAGALFAFGVSEKEHGADLLSNEFTLRETAGGSFVANGRKFYIGNANCASMVTILARKEDGKSDGRAHRALPALFVLRPETSRGFGKVRKIETLGIRAAFVGEFEVAGQEIPQADVIATGRGAWDGVLGTVTLGKFFLGFGSIGICEHAMAEAAAHLRGRILYGKPAIEMPHLRLTMARAYARLTAMKLYAYRALDYLAAASEDDRRYLLFNAVQKARVSTQGVKVMALLLECIGAKGFETQTYFEMALRDVGLIPGLEGSTHLNLGLTAQFIPHYFSRPQRELPHPKSLAAGEIASAENPYLFRAAAGSVNNIAFARFLDAYRPHGSIPNVRLFARQVKAFSLLVRAGALKYDRSTATDVAMALGQCLAVAVYGQLVCENAKIFHIPREMIAVIFDGLIQDFSMAAMDLAALPRSGRKMALSKRIFAVPQTDAGDWDYVFKKI